MKDAKSVPSVRFNQFSDEWRKYNLGEILEKYEEPVKTPKGGYDRLGIRSHAKGVFHTFVEEGHELSTGQLFKVRANNLIVNITFAWEHAVAITSCEDEGFFVSHRFPQFSFHDGFSPSFFKYVVSQEPFHRHLWLSSPGGAGRNRVLNQDEMLKFSVVVPSYSEQILIGTLFCEIDKLINNYQRKIDAFKNLKKVLLVEMFTADGSDKPRLRFKGFNDVWEQRRLDEIANRFDNLRIPIASNLRVSGPVPYYGANGIQDYVDGYTHDGENVLIAEDGANDLKNYPVRYVIGKIWVNNHAHVLRGKQGELDNLFFSFSLSQVDFESILVGGGRAKLNAETMMDIIIKLPKMKEQIRIGQLLYYIDTIITLHQRKLDDLKAMKTFFLQTMFI